MIWLFASVVLVLMVYVKAFRKFVLITAGVLLCLYGATAVYFTASEHQKKTADNAAWAAKPLCKGADPKQSWLESGGDCRPF